MFSLRSAMMPKHTNYINISVPNGYKWQTPLQDCYYDTQVHPGKSPDRSLAKR